MGDAGRDGGSGGAGYGADDCAARGTAGGGVVAGGRTGEPADSDLFEPGFGFVVVDGAVGGDESSRFTSIARDSLRDRLPQGVQKSGCSDEGISFWPIPIRETAEWKWLQRNCLRM